MRLWLWIVLFPAAAQADSVIAARLITPGAVIVAEDVALAKADIPDAIGAPDLAIGQSARIILYPGRPILARDLAPPAAVTRNQSVTLRFLAGRLAITAEGRALGQGAVGETVRVLNTVSKTTLTGLILADGTIEIGASPCAGC